MLIVMHPHLEHVPFHTDFGAELPDGIVIVLLESPSDLLGEMPHLLLLLTSELGSKPLLVMVMVMVMVMVKASSGSSSSSSRVHETGRGHGHKMMVILDPIVFVFGITKLKVHVGIILLLLLLLLLIILMMKLMNVVRIVESHHHSGRRRKSVRRQCQAMAMVMAAAARRHSVCYRRKLSIRQIHTPFADIAT